MPTTAATLICIVAHGGQHELHGTTMPFKSPGIRKYMGRIARLICKATTMAAWLLAVAPSTWAGVDLAPLRAQFLLPDPQVDYAEAKLVVDRLIDPLTDADAVRRELDRWEQAVRENTPAGATPHDQLEALLKTLYEPGPWNQSHPFTYDLDDPAGDRPENKRLTTYLATRQGNCVSMPVLMVIVGQRLGLPVTLATAPHHVLVKFGDATQGTWLNVEATSGGFKYDTSYEREFGITPLAIENGIYLRPLTPREGVGVIAGTLMEHFATLKDGDNLMEVADMALAVNPNDPVAMIWKGNAYYLQLQDRYISRYPTPADIPPMLLPDYQRLSRGNLAWYKKAEGVGWIEPTPERDAAYLRSLEHERTRRSP